MNTMVWTHIVYLAVSILITVWVGHMLQKHGKVFAMNGVSNGNALVDSFARLLEVGFYLLNFGIINIALRYGDAAYDSQTAIEVLSTKIGVVLLVLGVMHLLMTRGFNEMRKQRANERADVIIEE